MEYSNAELIKRIEKNKKKQKDLAHITDKKALTSEDKIKISLCKHFVQFAIAKRMKMKEVSELIDIPASRLSEFVNYKLTKFTIDQLIKSLVLLSKHDAKIRAYLDMIEQAVEVPTLKVNDSKKITKKLKEASTQSYARV